VSARDRRLASIAALLVGAAPSLARAQAPSSTDMPASVRMRFDVIFRGVPRYALTAQSNPVSADDRYWRTLALAPLQERANLDATNLLRGRVDVHLSAWSAIDLAAPTATDGRVAGDVAVGWARYNRGPWSAWAGRRFIAWGAPGGVHVDGIGADVQLAQGLVLEAVAGRPVTPTYGALLGGHPGFDGATAAGGLRVGWSDPGTLSASVSYLEQWAQGIPARRVAEASIVGRPTRWLDLRGTVSWDLLGLGVMQADVDASAWLGRSVELDVGYGHLDPALLIPRWSILSVFVTRTFDEARTRVAWRIVPALQVGAEGALLHYDVAGVDASKAGPAWGSRVEAFARVSRRDRRANVVAMVSRRDDGTQRMTLVRLAGSFPVVGSLYGAVEGAAALDDDDASSPRTSWYARVSMEGTVAEGWRLGASVDGVRSPIATSELRAMLHLTGRYDPLAGGAR
jgi:hypothetical protein